MSNPTVHIDDQGKVTISNLEYRDADHLLVMCKLFNNRSIKSHKYQIAQAEAGKPPYPHFSLGDKKACLSQMVVTQVWLDEFHITMDEAVREHQNRRRG